MIEIDVDRIRKAVDGAETIFDAWDRYRELGGILDFDQFVNTLVIFGIFIRRGCP